MSATQRQPALSQSAFPLNLPPLSPLRLEADRPFGSEANGRERRYRYSMMHVRHWWGYYSDMLPF
jgi:hypothetical protein